MSPRGSLQRSITAQRRNLIVMQSSSSTLEIDWWVAIDVLSAAALNLKLWWTKCLNNKNLWFSSYDTCRSVCLFFAFDSQQSSWMRQISFASPLFSLKASQTTCMVLWFSCCSLPAVQMCVFLFKFGCQSHFSRPLLPVWTLQQFFATTQHWRSRDIEVLQCSHGSYVFRLNKTTGKNHSDERSNLLH